MVLARRATSSTQRTLMYCSDLIGFTALALSLKQCHTRYRLY